MENKVSYAKLNLKVNSDVNTFVFQDTEITVLKYLPLKDKYDLISIALQQSKEDGIFNEIKLDMYFHLYLVYSYTNLSFTDKQKENEFKIFDTLKSSGFLDMFLATIEKSEYEELFEFLNIQKQNILDHSSTAAAILKYLIDTLPEKAETTAKIIESIDPEKYSQIIKLADQTGKNIK